MVRGMTFALPLLLSACTTAWIDAIAAQHRNAEAHRPSAPVQEAPSGTAGKQLIVRAWADADYRAVSVDWRAALLVRIDRANALLRGYGVELQVTSINDWDRRSSTSLAADLEALEAHDRGAGADLIVGLISASPVLTTSVHHLGYARVLGKHCVLRGMDDAVERDAILQSYSVVSREKLEGIYRERKQHKETAVLLHEWGHTLGAVHSDSSDDYMHTTYSTRQIGFSFDNAEIVRASLAASDRPAAARALLEVLDKRKQRRPLTLDETEIAALVREVVAVEDARAAQAKADAKAGEAGLKEQLQPLAFVTAEQGDKCRLRSMELGWRAREGSTRGWSTRKRFFCDRAEDVELFRRQLSSSAATSPPNRGSSTGSKVTFVRSFAPPHLRPWAPVNGKRCVGTYDTGVAPWGVHCISESTSSGMLRMRQLGPQRSSGKAGSGRSWSRARRWAISPALDDQRLPKAQAESSVSSRRRRGAVPLQRSWSAPSQPAMMQSRGPLRA